MSTWHIGIGIGILAYYTYYKSCALCLEVDMDKKPIIYNKQINITNNYENHFNKIIHFFNVFDF